MRSLLSEALPIVLLCLTVSCRHSSVANATTHFPFAYMQEDCGPTDGIATEFYFTATHSVTPIFGATLGSVEEAEERLAVCAQAAGAGSQTRIHGVGDGAVWITEQMEALFGTQAQYLVDFCHLCDYLSAAGEVIAANDKLARMEEKKDWLKDNRWKMFSELCGRA
jgi:hypothetical protein